MNDKPPVRYNSARQAGMLTMIPFLLGVAPVVGYFMGSWLDSKLGTDPVLMLVFLGLGFVAGVRETVLVVKKAGRSADDGDGDGSD